ncbi:MAG: hypothetical protein A2W26_00845 [Acidobacteria bacterium RBG_16_64_8]|nr:MAG: hypothetical protein A2W26_00845 [Acidobacteria bacterium RBG_16_64_8]
MEIWAPMQLLSLVLLLLGIVLAVSGIRLSGWIVAWILLSGALLLQGFRSTLSYLAEHGGVDPATYRVANDWMGLGFSLLIVASMYLMREVFAKHRHAEDKLSIVSTAARDAIIMIDHAGRIAFWNEAAQRMFGYSAQEAQGRKLHELIVPQRYRSDSDKGFAAFSSTGQGPLIGETLELTGLRKDGTEIITEHSISAVEINGEWHAIGIARDVSGRKAMQRELEQQLDELRRFEKVAVARELRMKELAEDNRALRERLPKAGRK